MVYKGMTLHKITKFYTEWFSICPNLTNNFCIITIFESCVKEINDLNQNL
jgi:hypothetical protein